MLLKVAGGLTHIVPASIGSAMTKALAARTQRPLMSPEQRDAIQQASKIYYGINNKNVAWAWGAGPLVILVHGWSGQAAQMAPLALHLAAQGFRAVAIDVTGHGSSPKQHTRWDYFLKDIASLSHTLDNDVDAIVAHSAGALAAMASRRLKGIHASRYVCICAPSYPFPPINVIRKKLNPPDSIVERYKSYIADQFENTWAQLETGISYADAGADLLLIYDRMDRFVDHTEGDKIRTMCPSATIIKTNAYGHTKILGSSELFDAIDAFLIR